MKQLILSLLMISTFISAADENYKLIDLKVLVNSGSFEEFFVHIDDIKPSERNEEWVELTLTSVKKYANQLIENELVNKKAFSTFKKLALHNTIAKKEIFIYKYYQIATEYFKKCIDVSCKNDLYSFWKQSDKNHDLAANLFEIFKYRPLIDNWLFVEKMVQSSVNESYCEKPEVQKILLENLIIKRENLNKPYNEVISAYVSPICFNKFSYFLKDIVKKNLDSKDEAFLILVSKGELTNFEKDLFYTSYILDRPHPGELFDKAWSNTLNLASSSMRRSRLIREFEKNEIVPDLLLGSKDIKKIDTVYGLINDNFPELIDYYANTCINYFKGTKVYSKGNPTMNCKTFFGHFKNASWLSKNYIQKFNELKLL